MIKTGINTLLLATSLFFLNCAGSGQGAGAESEDDETMDISNSSLEEAKQNAESAEWEAHRLREELERKKKGN